jgi:hypothetical protein
MFLTLNSFSPIKEISIFIKKMETRTHFASSALAERGAKKNGLSRQVSREE